MNRAARLRAIAHGGQALLSLATEELVRDALPEGVGLSDLGEQRLADLARPERVFQLVVPGVPADFPPLRTLDALPNNPPPQLTSFVGREHELAALRDLLAKHRLVTLTGPGGTGKTRLALQVAAEALGHFPDGVYVVSLAPITDPALVPAAVAGALGVREAAGRPLPNAVRDFLRAKDLLLVLDNCEQVLAAAPVLADLLAATPAMPAMPAGAGSQGSQGSQGSRRLKLLVTSREVLRLAGEHDLAVPSTRLWEQRSTVDHVHRLPRGWGAGRVAQPWGSFWRMRCISSALKARRVSVRTLPRIPVASRNAAAVSSFGNSAMPTAS